MTLSIPENLDLSDGCELTDVNRNLNSTVSRQSLTQVYMNSQSIVSHQNDIQYTTGRECMSRKVISLKVEIHTGSPSYVVFCSYVNQKDWNEENLHTFFFFPSKYRSSIGNLSGLCVRSSVSITASEILAELLRRWKLDNLLVKPILLCDEDEVGIHSHHSGRLWQCDECSYGCDIHQTFTKHHKNHKPMVAKMIPNDSFGRIWDRYNKPWGFRTNLKCLNKVISREPMPIGVATCSDVQLSKRRKIDLKKSIV